MMIKNLESYLLKNIQNSDSELQRKSDLIEKNNIDHIRTFKMGYKKFTRTQIVICLITVHFFLFYFPQYFYRPSKFESHVLRMPRLKSCTNLSRELQDEIKQNPRSICGCTIEKICMKTHMVPAIDSSCSLEASLLGPNQKVISFSLHKTTEKEFKEYLPGILENLHFQREFYSDWVIRIYTNVSLDSAICNAVCADPNIFFCNTTELPELGSVENLDPRAWRFLVLGDPTVSRFVSRDLDSRLGSRERAAVQEWEYSSLPFHAMRDSPHHTNKMLPGMWGGDNDKLGPYLSKTAQMELQTASRMDVHEIFNRILYHKYRRLMMIHDSYSCQNFTDSRPFPSKRRSRRDIAGGRNIDRYDLPPCPMQCRPKYGLRWKYC